MKCINIKSHIFINLFLLVLLTLLVSCTKFENFVGSTQGFYDSNSINAKFNSPDMINIDNFGNLYVLDQDYKTIRKITPEGSVSTIINLKDYKIKLFRIKDDYIYFSEDSTSIKRFNLKEDVKIEKVIGKEFESGNITGSFEIAEFNNIDDIAFDDNNLYVVDLMRDGIKIKKINFTLKNVETLKFESGGNSSAMISSDKNTIYFLNKIKIEINPKDKELYFTSNNKFEKNIFKINSKNQIISMFQNRVDSFTFDSNGNIYFIDLNNQKLTRITRDNKIELLDNIPNIISTKNDDTPITPVDNQTSMIIDNNRNILYLLEKKDNKIYKLNFKRVCSIKCVRCKSHLKICVNLFSNLIAMMFPPF